MTQPDREQVSAKLWEIAEHTIIAEWICCEPINPTHDLCVQGEATRQMVKALLVDDPESYRPAPLLDAVLALLPEPAAPVVRAAAFTEAADVAESLRQFEPATGARKSAQVSENVGILRVATELRRMAAEARQVCTHPQGYEGECPCPPSCICCTVTAAAEARATTTPDDGQLTEEQIVRNHVTTVHLIGEQLADVESWLWERLAEVRAAAPAAETHRCSNCEGIDPGTCLMNPDRAADSRPRCPDCQMPHDRTPSMVLACASIRASIADAAVLPVGSAEPQDETRVVAYVLAERTDLHCLHCTPANPGDIWIPVTAEELEDGGGCALCGVDVLIPQEAQR